jgi:hypothetical protein
MSRSVLMLWLMAAVALNACAKVVVVPLDKPGAPLKGEGMFYALPRTVAKVVLKVDNVSTTSARYARFAPIFTRGAEPACGNINDCAGLKGSPGRQSKYSLQQGATFSTFGEPDPDHVFMVKLTNGGTLDQTLSMAWNEAGLLSTASASVTNRTTDFVIAGVKLATSLATKAAAAGAAKAAALDKTPFPANSETQCAVAAQNDNWIIPVLLLIEPNVLQNELVANYCDLPPQNRDAKEENSRDDYDRTRDRDDLIAATRAYILRVASVIDYRTRLLTSAVNVLDPVPLVEKLDAVIDEELKGLFVGTKTTKTWELPFEVRELDPASPIQLLSVNETAGVCPDRKQLAADAKPAPDGFHATPPKCDGSDTSAKPVRVRVDYHPAQDTQLFSRVKALNVEESGDRSFRYRLPAQVKASVYINDTSYGAATFSVAQLGHVVSLPAHRHSKTMTYDLAMIEATGGLKTFKLGTTGGLDAATVDALAGAGGTVIDARNARLKEAEAEREETEKAADELTVLTRQQTILKLKDEICQLQKKYGLACTVSPE